MKRFHLLCLVFGFVLVGCKPDADTTELKAVDSRPAMDDDTKKGLDHYQKQCTAVNKSTSSCYCKPDITKKLEATIWKVSRSFHQLSNFQKLRKCANLPGEFVDSLGGWDIDFGTGGEVVSKFKDFMAGYCGTCTKSVNGRFKACYEAKINGVSTKQDLWDINYALYGAIQGLCGNAQISSETKIKSWKSLKGEDTSRLWFWYSVGRYIVNPDNSSMIETAFKKFKRPTDHPYYRDCQLCPGSYKYNIKPFEYKSYIDQ